MSGLRQVVKAATQLASTAVARGSRSYPSPQFARDGFVTDEQFVSGDDAAAMLADVQSYTDQAVTTTGVAGTVLRDRSTRQTRDLHVRQLTHAELLSPAIRDLYESGRIETAFAQLVGRPLRIGGMTVQIDWPDTTTKRGLHVDSHWPPTYKTFVYLTDVPARENGPFSVVPGSHRHTLRKLRAIAGDYRHGRDRTDLDHEYAFAEARCLTGGPGTAIFADQRLAHAGCPEHTRGTRVMIVAYLYEPDVEPPRFLGGANR